MARLTTSKSSDNDYYLDYTFVDFSCSNNNGIIDILTYQSLLAYFFYTSFYMQLVYAFLPTISKESYSPITWEQM